MCLLITTVHCRYMIPRYTDVEQFFSVGPEDGIIKTTRPLDRETLPWHNISVSATEIGTPPSTSGFKLESSWKYQRRHASRSRNCCVPTRLLCGPRVATPQDVFKRRLPQSAFQKVK